jgi:hypothetical protein
MDRFLSALQLMQTAYAIDRHIYFVAHRHSREKTYRAAGAIARKSPKTNSAKLYQQQ